VKRDYENESNGQTVGDNRNFGIAQHSGTYGKPVSRNWQGRSALRTSLRCVKPVASPKRKQGG
jgi:hypothetical protein